MDSYYPDQLSKDTDWEEVEKIPLPSAKSQKKSVSEATHRSKTDSLETSLHENENLMNRLSMTLRKNSFMESKINSIENLNKKLIDKNIFLQDQFLILKEKHQTLMKNKAHFTQDLHNNSEELKKLKTSFSTLENQLKNIKKEKTHTLSLNRHLVQKLTSVLQQNKKTSEENTNLKNQISKTEKAQSLIQNFEKTLTSVKKKHSQEIHQINKTQDKQEKRYQDTIQTLKKSACNNQKQYLSQMARLKKQIQKKEQDQQKTQNKVQKIKDLNLQLSNYLTKISKKGDLFQEWNKSIVQRKEHLWQKNTQKLIHQYEKRLSLFKKEAEQHINQIIEKNRKILSEKESALAKREQHYKSIIADIKTQQNQKLKEQEEKQITIIKRTAGEVQQVQSQANKILLKYNTLKQKWNERIAQVISKKTAVIHQLSSQYTKDKKQLIQSFQDEKRNIELNSQQEIQKAKQDFEQDTKQKVEEKNRKLEELKQKIEEQQQAHIQKTQELIYKHNQDIEELRKKYEKKQEDNTERNQKIMMEKEKAISQLNKELETLNQNYSDYEQNIRRKIEEDFEKEKTNLTSEKKSALAKREHHYESLIINIKEKQDQELKDLKEKYENEFYEKSSILDDRIIELKEEHDNQLHNLRVEMENELLAEKRKSAAENEQNIKDIQKLQKEFRELQSELELKNLKVVNMKLDSTNNRTELQKLRLDNQELKQKSDHLQILWENQGPEMEEQKQQITSLQKLNRQLSQYIHENQLKSQSHTHNNDLNKNQKTSDVSELLKNIHLYDKNI